MAHQKLLGLLEVAWFRTTKRQPSVYLDYVRTVEEFHEHRNKTFEFPSQICSKPTYACLNIKYHAKQQMLTNHSNTYITNFHLDSEIFAWKGGGKGVRSQRWAQDRTKAAYPQLHNWLCFLPPLRSSTQLLITLREEQFINKWPMHVLVSCPFQPVHLYFPSLDIIKNLQQVLQATTSTWSVKMHEQWANRILFLLLNFPILKLKVCVGQVFDVQTTQMFGLDIQRSCTQDRHQFEGMPNHPNQQSSLVRPPEANPASLHEIKSFLVIHFFGCKSVKITWCPLNVRLDSNKDHRAIPDSFMLDNPSWLHARQPLIAPC